MIRSSLAVRVPSSYQLFTQFTEQGIVFGKSIICRLRLHSCQVLNPSAIFFPTHQETLQQLLLLELQGSFCQVLGFFRSQLDLFTRTHTATSRNRSSVIVLDSIA